VHYICVHFSTVGVIGEKKQLSASCFFDQSQTTNSVAIYANSVSFQT